MGCPLNPMSNSMEYISKPQQEKDINYMCFLALTDLCIYYYMYSFLILKVQGDYE